MIRLHDLQAESGPLLAALAAASVSGRVALGPRAGQRALRFGDHVEVTEIPDERGRGVSTSREATEPGGSPCQVKPGSASEVPPETRAADAGVESRWGHNVPSRARMVVPTMAYSPPVRNLEELRRVLVRAVAKTCPGWLADRREDIVQNALVRVLESLERGEEKGMDSPSYLWRLGYHATVDEIRRLRRRPEERMDPGDLDRALGEAVPGPDRLRESRAIGDAVADCLSAMVPPRRTAVQLLLYGYGLSESARILGWGVKQADNLRSRGLADLRRCLREKGMEP